MWCRAHLVLKISSENTLDKYFFNHFNLLKIGQDSRYEKKLPNFVLCVGESDGHKHSFIQTVDWEVKSFYERGKEKYNFLFILDM